jgi:hypothetical protein
VSNRGQPDILTGAPIPGIGGEMRTLNTVFRYGLYLTFSAVVNLTPSQSFSSPIPLPGVAFISPQPGAKYVRPRATIILRCSRPVVGGLFPEGSFITATGTRSGVHSGTVLRSGDYTLIFKPAKPFAWDEKVTVHISPEFLTWLGTTSPTLSYAFSIAPRNLSLPRPFAKELDNLTGLRQEPSMAAALFPAAPAADSLPSTFPAMKISDNGDTSSGFLFLSNFTVPLTTVPYLMILRDNGSPIFYRAMSDLCTDFKVQPNGRMTYFDNAAHAFFALDSTYAVVDSFRTGNGYTTDLHELRILPNGHALLLAFDPETVDMSKVVKGGDTTATVIGLVIQELDAQKNVVFQWRSWDHFAITDATHEVLTASTVDYVHGNALELDADGNILLSCRHMDEITKIDRQTGDIIWRWGGRHNQFTFVNDSIGFSHQHALRRIANGDFTIFDNGNFHLPSFSRAVEYALDEKKMTATLVWQFRHSPDVYGQAMGYVQRLPNGNSLICWGAANPSVTEVRPDGSVVYELNLPYRSYSYRAYRQIWESDEIASTPPSGSVPADIFLAQNYPNPFNPTTTIQYGIPQPSSVTLAVYDMLGQKVSTLVDDDLQAGDYSVEFDGSGLASGVYLYRLMAGNAELTRKFLLLR